jgi:hypothetical protein
MLDPPAIGSAVHTRTGTVNWTVMQVLRLRSGRCMVLAGFGWRKRPGPRWYEWGVTLFPTDVSEKEDPNV